MLTAPTLCVGMATYDDFDGVWFTVQSICLHQPEVLDDLSFVVLDNYPEGAAAESLRTLADYVPNLRYVPFAGYRGTAVRDLLFREADAEIVCCLDSHVLLAPGALAALQRWFGERPDSLDLLQGPIAWDDLRNGTTHMEPTWRAGMFGTWAEVPALPEIGDQPFEIEMHGLGAFACRREAWPGINPRFRGFGGEEGYLHEKVRRRGGRVLCHPALRWVHRFGRPDGIAYVNVWEDRIRNYILGWSELGWDLSDAEDHFGELLGVGAKTIWRRAQEQVEHPLSAFDGVFCVSDRDGACDGHAHPESVAWRVERVDPGTAADHRMRRIDAWRKALGAAQQRGYETALVLEDAAGELDLVAARQLIGGVIEWDLRWLGPGAIAVHSRAFASIIDELGEGDADAAAFLAAWGDLVAYLLELAAADERPAVVTGVEAIGRANGLTLHDASASRVYDLNASGAIVFGLCDGTRTIPEIADAVATGFNLQTPPVAEVAACVGRLRDLGIVAKIAS